MLGLEQKIDAALARFRTISNLWAHEDEAKGVDCADQRIEDPGVPGFVGLVLQGIDGITNDNGVERIA